MCREDHNNFFVKGWFELNGRFINAAFIFYSLLALLIQLMDMFINKYWMNMQKLRAVFMVVCCIS